MASRTPYAVNKMSSGAVCFCKAKHSQKHLGKNRRRFNAETVAPNVWLRGSRDRDAIYC